MEHRCGPVANTKWIAEDALILCAAESIYARKLRLSSLRRHISGRRMYAIFYWRDPLPLLKCVFRNLAPFSSG